MKSQLLGGLCVLITAFMPVKALAQIGVPTTPSDFDIRYQRPDPQTGRVTPPRYHSLPDLANPLRTLPAAFRYPIIYELGVNRNIRSDAVITDEVFIPNLPPIPAGITLDNIPRVRAEYTRRVEEWGERIQECKRLDPLIVKTDTGNPVLINRRPAGRILLNANNISVCPSR